MSKNTDDFLAIQRDFSELFFDAAAMSEEELIARHQVFSLALHSEVSELASAVHYKDHRPTQSETQRQKILYETVDIMRYCLAVLNLWDFTAEDYEDAFDSRDAFLWDRETRGLQNWSGQPVIVVDVDDVLAQFRLGFFGWIKENFGIDIDVENPYYYNQTPVGDLSDEEAYMEFIKAGGIRSLPINDKIVESLNNLREQGYWIHLLTARPAENLKCLYDTCLWLSLNKVPYDSIAFSAEKYRWLLDKDFFKQGKMVCAVDDSPKHAAEYAQQGLNVFVPRRSYNSDVWDMKNVISFDWWEDDLSEKIERLLSDTSNKTS